jgi:hypothetical protein
MPPTGCQRTTRGAYRAGTMFMINGQPFDPNAPDPFAESDDSVTGEDPRLTHLPVHASWLNQIELYFSILQRKALTPNDLPTLGALAERLLGFGEHWIAPATG